MTAAPASASVRRNVVANFAGQSWSALMHLAFLPVYARLLGIETYGLVGIWLSLLAASMILDFGLSSTLNRQVAANAHTGAAPALSRDMARTLETLYWPIAAVIALAAFVASDLLASVWVQPVTIGAEQIRRAFVLMGLAIAAQWPAALYTGGLRGLQRQVALNVVIASFATLRGAGVVAALLLIEPTIEVFMGWQVAVGVLQTLTLAALFWRSLPRADARPRFRMPLLREVAGFSIGLTVIASLGVLLTQADRFVLSGLLPLDEFAYYALAATAATALAPVATPFFGALYPRFCGLVATGDEARLTSLYHVGTQWLSLAVAPPAAVLAWFGSDALRLWSGDAALAAASGPLLSIIVVGTGMNCMMTLPYALQLAYGSTRIAMVQNALSLLAIVPALVLLVPLYGARVAAFAWVALNAAYLLVTVPLMHRRLLRGERDRWYVVDVLPTFVAAFAVAGLARWMMPGIAAGLVGIAQLAVIGAVTFAAAAVASPVIRARLRR